MRPTILTGSTAICLCMGLGVPLLADTAPTTGTTTTGTSTTTAPTAAIAPAQLCLGDLTAFQARMQKDGHWFGGTGYSYPMMGGYGTGGGIIAPSDSVGGYMNVRPGYEVRSLVVAANVLAQNGQQEACETVLASAQGIYKTYSAQMASGTMGITDASAYHAKQIADAVPVASLTRSMRSDELLGTEVRNGKDEALGSVDDLVMSPQSGQIGYLVISRGGFFGFDQKYVPVPWADFALTPDGSFLLLAATADMMKAAPQVDHNQVMAPGEFATVSKTVDAYWAKILPPQAGN